MPEGPKRPVHLGAVALLVAELLVMGGQVTAKEAVKETTVAKDTSTPQVEKDGVDQAEPTTLTGSGVILVSKRPIEMLAGPSSSASAMYGFPAGRRFRLISHHAGFAQIQDLKSGATGWIDVTAMGQSPSVPAVSVASEHKPHPRNHTATTASAEPKPKTHVPGASMPSKSKPAPRTSQKTTAASAEWKAKTTKSADRPTGPVQTPKRRGIFGLRGNSAQGILF